MNTYYLSFILSGIPGHIICGTTQDECARLQDVLTSPDHKPFFWFSANNNRDVIINLNHIQAVRVLRDISQLKYRPNSSAEDDIVISLANNERALQIYSDAPAEVYTFFKVLELGSDRVKFTGFTGRDGALIANTNEITVASAPSSMLNEGKRIIRAGRSPRSDQFPPCFQGL